VRCLGCAGDNSGAEAIEPARSGARNASGQFAPISVLNPEATLEASVLGSWRGGMYSDNTPADRPVYDR
jgi:hypothetical protein